MSQKAIALLDNTEGRQMIKEACRSRDLRFAEFEELVQTEMEQIGKIRRAGLWDAFDDILDRIQIED